MNIRMIGFDLDGTLLTTDKILTERTKKALEAAADQGVILVPATGRAGISNTQRYKCIGNGWRGDVIAHILGGLQWA